MVSKDEREGEPKDTTPLDEEGSVNEGPDYEDRPFEAKAHSRYPFLFF